MEIPCGMGLSTNRSVMKKVLALSGPMYLFGVADGEAEEFTVMRQHRI